MADANPNPNFVNEAAALKKLIETDPKAAVAQIKAGESKAALHHPLNTDPQFRPQTSTYSTLLGWTDGTGVWVLDGNEQVYRDLKRLGDDHPSLSYNECLEKLGATYYNTVSIRRLHTVGRASLSLSREMRFWAMALTSNVLGNEHPATREAMENQVSFREGPGTTARVE